MSYRDSQRFRKVYGYYRPYPRSTDPSLTASEQIVNDVVAGIDWKQSARVASNININLTSPGSIDGVTLVDEDRVLLKEQTNPAENGIYIYYLNIDSLIRTNDAVQDTLTSGAAIYIEEGSTNNGTAWLLSTSDPITVDSTAQTWVLFSTIYPVFIKSGSYARSSVDVAFGDYFTNEIGSDVVFYVSGTIGNTLDPKIAVFGGDVLISGSLTSFQGFSGSLTQLADGTSYLIAGDNVTITSASNGSITISAASSSAGDITSVYAGTGLLGGGTSGNISLSIDDSVIATLTGSTFSGVVNFNEGLSGSLTQLTDGTSYLIAGDNITIVSQSNGSITISGQPGDITAAYAGIGLLGGGTSGDVTFDIDDSIVATLTGSTFSGVVNFNEGLSGSLTQLTDGTSYLIAGNNVTIVSESNGSIIISAVGGSGGSGSITVSSGSTTVPSMTELIFGPGLLINQDSLSIVSVTASIGEPEDGTYQDGIFTDFTTATPIGVAIDRFNELFLALAPSPAPALDYFDCDTAAGIAYPLSFGASNDQSLASPAYISSNTTAGFSAVDVNGIYSAAVSGNNIRKGIYAGTTSISGDLNEDVVAYVHNTGVTNYVANSFGDADKGNLELYVNGSLVHSVDLTSAATGTGIPGSGTASRLNSNGSGFTNLSQTGSAVQSNTLTFSPFQHRTGKYVVHPLDQRNGWNYAQVIHNIGSSQTSTNYVEWINDDNADALTASNNSLTFEGSGSIHLSGVEYFQSGSLVYKVKVDNAYKYIYDTNAITFTTSNSAAASSGLSVSFTNQTKPTIDIGAGEDHTKALHLTASSPLAANYFTNGTITVGTTVTHPRKTNLTNGGQASTNEILTYNYTNTSTALQETFRREDYRIISGAYVTQADVIDSANVWDSNVYMTASNGGHSDGLQFFNTLLKSPTNTVNGGDFTIFSGGPGDNPDYSGISGIRTFYRWFKNTSGTQYDISLSMNGSSTIVSDATALNSTRIKAFIKVPEKTGWLDVALPYVIDQVDDGDGTYIANAYLTFDNTLLATNYLNFGNVSIANNEYLVLKIVADSTWTGNISGITVDFGAGTGTLSPVPDLDDIDYNTAGSTAKLSFGASKPITGYTNSSTDAGFTAVDLNGQYLAGSSGNNLRSGIYNGPITMEGELNADVVSPGKDYVTYAFSDANTGSLKLEINGSIVHEVEITGSVSLVGAGSPGSGTGTSLNANGSGFVGLSQWGPGMFDNGVPRFSEIQRTSRYRVSTTEQREGWNYVRVIHSVNGVDRETNYVEWIIDSNTDALTSAGDGMTIFGDDTFSHMSGVTFFTSPSGSILTRISNIYKNVYTPGFGVQITNLTNLTTTGAQLIQSGAGLTSTRITASSLDNLQSLNTNTDSQNELLHVTGTVNVSSVTKSLPGARTTSSNCSGRFTFIHPFKSSLLTPLQTATKLLIWNPSDTSNASTNEYFTGETYRLVSGSYTSQTDITGGSYDWDSTISMDDQTNYPEYATGLLIYDTYLLPPKDGGISGDFRNHKEGGGIESPAGNVDYSSLTNSTREYYRPFLNNTTDDRPSIQVTLYGDATIVGLTGPNAGALGANKNIFVQISIPGKTGLLDLAKPSAGSGNFNEGDGCLSGDFNATVTTGGVTNVCTFNGATVNGTVSGAEYIIVRISAADTWTGYLDRISISWS